MSDVPIRLAEVRDVERQIAPDISIVIPAFNEAERIAPTLDELVEHCRARDLRFEIVVVDDGSVDDTVALARSHPSAPVVLDLPRGGKAAAKPRRGVRDAEASRAAILQAALDEFSSVGYDGARVDRIAEQAGLSKPLLYDYFGDKDELYKAIRNTKEAEHRRNPPTASGSTSGAALPKPSRLPESHATQASSRAIAPCPVSGDGAAGSAATVSRT